MPQFSAEQEKAAFSYLRTQARLMYDRKEKVSVVGASERPRPTEAEIGRGIDVRTKQNLLDQWMKVYSATTAADKDAAMDSLLGALKNYDQGIISLVPKNSGEGVTVKYSDGRTKDYEFKDVSGNLKSPEQWAAAGTGLHHLEESNYYTKYKETNFSDLTKTEWGSTGASYNMPAQTTAKTPKENFVIFLNGASESINNAIGMVEGEAVTHLTALLKGTGFTIAESFAPGLDRITVTAPDETYITIPTDEDDPAAVAERLSEWMKNKITDEKAAEWNESIGKKLGVGSKY
jgi:hypothetical protein